MLNSSHRCLHQSRVHSWFRVSALLSLAVQAFTQSHSVCYCVILLPPFSFQLLGQSAVSFKAFWMFEADSMSGLGCVFLNVDTYPLFLHFSTSIFYTNLAAVENTTHQYIRWRHPMGYLLFTMCSEYYSSKGGLSHSAKESTASDLSLKNKCSATSTRPEKMCHHWLTSSESENPKSMSMVQFFLWI